MKIITAGGIAFLLTIFLICVFRPILVKAKLGQKILDIGPSWHKCKEGTPMMGGVFFGFSILLATALVLLKDILSGTQTKLIICMLLALAHASIGFIDDYIKMFKKRNKGLSVIGKLLLQFLVTAGFLLAMNLYGFITTELYIPVIDIFVDLGIMYYIFMMLIIVYIVNCANLTDGIDGLAGSISLIIMVMFMLLGLNIDSIKTISESVIATNEGTLILAGSIIGALIGFLIFNFHPAKIIMGDTGSFFLGAMVVGMTFMFDMPLLIIPLAFIYIIEGISDVLQVLSYKLTGKRIFKMAPIHHHFEKCGWSEVKIVGVFTFITALFCALSYFIYIRSY
ncbi:MAG: phospho-N-acetylmuramoyl-pentapeptide-transferase [Clostridiales bacterium GWF2_38_85]|nr:MAG: phospho-N-acetylmuramoyl-pentapeptide-transferase [Clostridiales bacterium GWF2_38_85]HBL85401.1 phospho-N-acetylmuramoyl-pentapeptide-transferase [Clostridiales bacterium]